MESLKINRLKKKIGFNNKLIIYGAGNFARTYGKELIQKGMHIEYCIVTKKERNITYFDDIFVYSIDEKIEDIRRNGIVILVMVSDSLVSEIKDILERYGLKNYLLLTDFIRTSFEHKKSVQIEKDWIEYIAEWYVDTSFLSITDLYQAKKEIKAIISDKKSERRIVFIAGHVAPRVIKMAEALIESGYDITILFYSKITLNNHIYEELKEIADCFFCEYMEEILFRIVNSRAKIVHILSNYNNGSTTASYMLIHAKSILPKIVFEQYDIANGMYWSVEKRILQEERFCLENSDGVCCRGNEIDFLLNKMHFNIKGKIIKFFDYIGNEILYYENSNELSLCYGGYFVTEKEYPGVVYACMLEFAKLCEKNHCHFHLYPSVWDEKRYKDYIELSQKSIYFHFHTPISYKELIKNISHFDYEVIPCKKGFLQKRENGTYTQMKMIYAATNKFFDSLEAGLPIIAPFPVKFADYFEKKGVLLNWTIDKFDFDQLRKRKVELKKKVNEFREQLRMKYRIHDLIDFYNTL